MITLAGIHVRRDVVSHPLLGQAQVIEASGAPVTAISLIDWDRPTQIPTIAEPGRLPSGAGAALLNELAVRAERAGVRALRYAGPYPTPGLWRALARSFRTTGDEGTFTADVLGRALRLARDEIPVDFAPAPHERVLHAHGFSELRGSLERTVIDGISYERDGSPARLDLDARRAELWFGDACYARIATLSPRGELVDGPHPPPPLASAVIGQTFPAALRAALAELVAEAVPPPLASDARAIIIDRTLAWADLGGRAARRSASGFELHAALWERIAPLGLARLALAIAEALAPVATSTILAELARTR